MTVPPTTPQAPTQHTPDPRWVRCAECGHFRADHDAAGCTVSVPQGGFPTPCACLLDFLAPEEDPHD